MFEARFGRRWRIRSLAALLLAALAGACDSGNGDGLTPERRKFFEKFDALRVDMSWAEVDGLMAGYPSEEWRKERDSDPKLRPLPRPSVVSVNYEEKVNANERDYVATAYFDKDGRLVGKFMSQYAK
jgi:hypothetical protein